MTLDFKVLPHQKLFIKATKNTMLVAGYGSGKSYIGTLKTIMKKLQYPTKKVAYYLPTYPLVRDIAFDKFTEVLTNLELKFKLNKSDKEIHIDNYGTIIFRSMDNPETIIGYEVAYSLIDEADILPMDKMEKVYNKILGRNRAIDGANVDAVSTPEGFKWLYEQSNKGHFEVIKAKTMDNKFLPLDYIDQLRDQYPPALLEAYLNGEFVNLATGTIFSYFNRETHHSDIVMNDYEELIIGQDFNIDGSVSIVYVERGNEIIAVDEYESYDTRGIIENTKNNYPDRIISFYPDASGNNRKTNASETDISMLINAGFTVYVNNSNPSVKDRINITNNLLDKKIFKVNTLKCPKFTKALEQHSYTEKGEPEKLHTAGSVDDYTDAGTYPLAYLYPIIQPMTQSKIIGL